MKKLYEFTVTKKEKVDVEDISQNEKGEEVKITRKEDKEVPYKFFLRRPTRLLTDDANLFYGVKVAEGIKAGLMTIPQLETRNLTNGGELSDLEKEEYKKLWGQLAEAEKEYQLIQIKKADEISEEEKKKSRELAETITTTRSELQKLENFHTSIFDNTAEVRARNHLVVWWLLNLAYKEVAPEKYEPFFGEGGHDKKLQKYDEFIENDEDTFSHQVILKFLTYVSLWVNNKALTSEDFQKVEQMLKDSPDDAGKNT